MFVFMEKCDDIGDYFTLLSFKIYFETIEWLIYFDNKNLIFIYDYRAFISWIIFYNKLQFKAIERERELWFDFVG